MANNDVYLRGYLII